MNWIKLKEKFPNSEKEIREFYNNSVIKDSRLILECFLKSKGYSCGLTFITELKEYEIKVKQINIKKRKLAKQKGFSDWSDFLYNSDKSKKHHKALDSFYNTVFEQ